MSQSLKKTEMKMKTHITQNTNAKCTDAMQRKERERAKRQFNTTKTINNDNSKNISNDQSDPDPETDSFEFS